MNTTREGSPPKPLVVQMVEVYGAKRQPGPHAPSHDDPWDGWVRGGEELLTSASFGDPRNVTEWGRPFTLDYHTQDPTTNRLVVIDILADTFGKLWLIVSNTWRSATMPAPAFNYFAVRLDPESPMPCIGDSILPHTFAPATPLTREELALAMAVTELGIEIAHLRKLSDALADEIAAALNRFLCAPDFPAISLGDSADRIPCKNPNPRQGPQS